MNKNVILASAALFSLAAVEAYAGCSSDYQACMVQAPLSECNQRVASCEARVQEQSQAVVKVAADAAEQKAGSSAYREDRRLLEQVASNPNVDPRVRASAEAALRKLDGRSGSSISSYSGSSGSGSRSRYGNDLGGQYGDVGGLNSLSGLGLNGASGLNSEVAQALVQEILRLRQEALLRQFTSGVFADLPAY